MSIVLDTLALCPLFAGLSAQELATINEQARLSVRQFTRDQVVAFEEDESSTIGIVAAGSIHIQRLFASGKAITIETFHRGDSFGEALVFADQGQYPATLIAKDDTTVVFLAKTDILHLCSTYPQFMQNYMRTLSNKVLLLNRKIKSLSFTTIRQKVTNYILQEAQMQQSNLLALSLSRSELADSLGIPRPSLSRELIALKQAGWIDFDRRTIRIQDRSSLEKALMA